MLVSVKKNYHMVVTSWELKLLEISRVYWIKHSYMDVSRGFVD